MQGPTRIRRSLALVPLVALAIVAGGCGSKDVNNAVNEAKQKSNKALNQAEQKANKAIGTAKSETNSALKKAKKTAQGAGY